MDTNNERRREQRLRYHWPVWFAENFNEALSQGQMVDVSSTAAAFTCRKDEHYPYVGQHLTARFSVPRFRPGEAFDMANFTRSGRICRVDDVNQFSRRVAVQFAKALPFKPGEQADSESETQERLAAVSHELKTPLASISAYSEMLVDGEADDEQTRKEFYSVIQSQAKRLNRLIEGILNTSRIESGLIKVEKKPISLTIVVEEQLQMIRGYAGEKNIEIVGQKPIVFDQVYADKDMISQVIVNLLSNAVKYTPCGGSIKIETEVDEIAGLARVSITDTGVGIPKAEIEHIFDKFYRVGANKKQAEGTGLGLNLVKQIVEKVHNGRVFVTSEPGVGSTFGFELPLATAEVVKA